jgi:lysozyme family protein
MDAFSRAIEFSLKWEGGYSNDPLDPGGETRYGISKRSYPDLDIAHLTRLDAIDIYRRDFWGPAKCNVMRFPLSMVHFDCAINSGIHQAAIILQRTLGVVEDGNIGPKTLAATREKDADIIAILAIEEREHFYRVLAEKQPKLKRYLAGWMNRCASLKKAINETQH